MINRPIYGGGINAPNININRPTVNRPIVNRPGVGRPPINRPGNVIAGGIVNNNNLTNVTNNITSNRVNNIVNKNTTIVNRPGWGGGRYGQGGWYGPAVVGAAVPSVVAAQALGVGGYYGGGFYGGGYVDPGYSYSSPGYAPTFGMVGNYSCPYPDYAYGNYDECWQKGFWSGLGNLAGNVITAGIGLAAAQQPPTVIYNNPYQTQLDTTPAVPALDYSQPIEVATTRIAAKQDTDLVQDGMKRFELARALFKQEDYPRAQREVEAAIALVPNSPPMHEFRALCQFAQSKYQDAAATLYAVLDRGPGSDWNTIGSLYSSEQEYGRQLKRLEDSIRDGANEPWRHFLLGYQYMVLSEREAALAEFKEAARLDPKDQVSRRIVQALEEANGSPDVPDPSKGEGS